MKEGLWAPGGGGEDIGRPRRREVGHWGLKGRKEEHWKAKEEGGKTLKGQGGGRKGIVRPRRKEKRHCEAKEEGEKAL